MSHVQATCPHCLTEKAPLSAANTEAFSINEKRSVVFILMQCGVCRNSVMLLTPLDPNIRNWISGNRVYSLPVITIIPEVEAPAAPGETPENIRRFYVQGLDSLSRQNFDAAGVMFRKALDIAIKNLNPAGKGTLFSRINSIPDAAGVTQAMKDWAHEIRDLGNDAAHEDEPFEKTEVQQLQAFTEMFLRFAYTLPAMIEARKQTPTA